MSAESVQVQVGELRKYPKPPSDFEVDIGNIDLLLGSLGRNQSYRRYGLVGLIVPTGGLFEGTRETRMVWNADLMKYSAPKLEIVHNVESALRVTPDENEGMPLALPPYLLRPGVNPHFVGGVRVTEEGFALGGPDVYIPSGVDRPIGRTLARAMETGETTDLLAGRTFVWVGEQHAGKSLFRIPLGMDGTRGYRDVAMIGPSEGGDVYRDGSPVNVVYPSRVIQVMRS